MRARSNGTVALACTLAALLVSCLLAVNATAATFYISPTATTDDPSCSSGTSPAQAWRSLGVQYTANCIAPGDTVIFLAGTYSSASTVFFLNSGRILMNGASDKPITLKAEAVSGVAHPVKFTGEFSVLRSSHLIIDGIEFTRRGSITSPDTTQNLLGIGDVHDILFKNVWIHGYSNEHCPHGSSSCATTSLKDCVKIDGGLTHSDFVTFEDSKIHDCKEDAIDVTGRRGITVRNTEIYNAWQVQIKGGAEDIVLENNYLHHMRYGIMSGGMNCTNDSVAGNAYCGSPEQLTLPAADRFQARNVIIKNNTIESLELGPTVNATGWRNAYIHDNRVIEGNYSSASAGAMFEIRDDFGISAYFDDLALAYCSGSPVPAACVSTGTTPPDANPNNDVYWRIRSISKDIHVFRNSLHGRSPSMLRLNSAISEPNICMFGNTYSSTSGGSPIFSVDGVTLPNDTLPTCGTGGAGQQ